VSKRRSASHRTRRSLTPACAPDDAHVAEEEHLPLRERLADAWQVLLMCFDCFLLNEALTLPLGDASCRASRTMSGWRRWRRRRPEAKSLLRETLKLQTCRHFPALPPRQQR
jgi:hypothetical protein